MCPWIILISDQQTLPEAAWAAQPYAFRKALRERNFYLESQKFLFKNFYCTVPQMIWHTQKITIKDGGVGILQKRNTRKLERLVSQLTAMVN